MPESGGRDYSAFNKALVVFGIGAGVGLGLCGLEVMGHVSGAGLLGAGLLVLSVAGLVITGMVWAAVAIYDAVRR
jgi:hypothetical protein